MSRILRRTPIRKRRPGPPRRGQLNQAEKHAIREAIYERDGGVCRIRLHPDCSQDQVLPKEGSVFERAHLVHLKSRGAGGTWQDSNLLIGCPKCHLISMHTQGKKPINPISE